jgi:hypothetical protein
MYNPGASKLNPLDKDISMRRFQHLLALFFFGIAVCPAAFACNATLSPGTDIQTALNGVATTVCLNPGTYRPTNTIYVPAGKTLKGLGANRDQVVIESAVGSGSVMIWPSASVTLYNFTLISAPNRLPTYGVFVNAPDIVLWSLHVKKALINVALISAARPQVLDMYLSQPGDPNDRAANPNLWISNSTDVTVWYGALFGGGGFGTDPNGALTGDGELSVYGSDRVAITGTNFFDSGTSAVYFRDCDSCAIKQVAVYNARGFGLDLVDAIDNPLDGNDNLVVENNSVSGSGYGGAIIKLTGGNSVRFTGNNFSQNNTTGNSACSGINILGTQGSLILQSNTVSPGPISCVAR